jgi:hypothetical protein
LGHEHAAVAGGDVGGVVLYDIGLRYPGFVTRQMLFNTMPPPLDEVYAAAGLPPDDVRGRRAQSDYFVRQANDPEGLLAELDTPERRERYVAGMYGHRLWGTPNAFTPEDVAFHTEPYADAQKLRASWWVYEQTTGRPDAVRWKTFRASSSALPCRRWCCTDRTTTWCCRRSLGVNALPIRPRVIAVHHAVHHDTDTSRRPRRSRPSAPQPRSPHGPAS